MGAPMRHTLTLAEAAVSDVVSEQSWEQTNSVESGTHPASWQVLARLRMSPSRSGSISDERITETSTSGGNLGALPRL
jgi:hypothetical protein